MNREATIFCAGVCSSIYKTFQSVDGIINPMSLSVICPDCRSQPVTRSKTEGGAQMIVLQCFTTTRVGLETYPFKSKLLTISDFCSTSNVGKQASGAAHPESIPCIQPMNPAHASDALPKYILLSFLYKSNIHQP